MKLSQLNMPAFPVPDGGANEDGLSAGQYAAIHITAALLANPANPYLPKLLKRADEGDWIEIDESVLSDMMLDVDTIVSTLLPTIEKAKT